MKTIIITGASSGIGKAVARIANLDRYQLVLASRSEEVLKELDSSVEAECLVVPTDVSNPEQCRNLIAKTLDRFGQIDVLINNAGLGYFDPLENGSLDQWHHMVDVNVKGVLSCLHAALPHLIESKGQVINIGSIASHQVFPESGVYCATKHALFAISESLRVELNGKVRVTTISPGAVNTSFIDQTTNEEILGRMKGYFASAMAPETIARQILHAIEVSDDAVINEIIVRPFR